MQYWTSNFGYWYGQTLTIRSSPTDYLPYLNKNYLKNVTHHTWHLKHDTWHVKYDTWHLAVGEHSLKILDPLLLRFGSEGFWNILRKRMSHSMNQWQSWFWKAPTTLGLSKLDGVGPVDNRPSTNKLHHFVKQKKKLTCDTLIYICRFLFYPSLRDTYN